MIRTIAVWLGQEAAMQIVVGDVTLDFILDERAGELDGEGQTFFVIDQTRCGMIDYELAKAGNF
jgi:hypothetical protein